MKNRQQVQYQYVQSIVDHMTTEELAEYVHYMMMQELDCMSDEELVEEIELNGEGALLKQ